MTQQSVPFDRAVDYYDATRGFPPGDETAIAGLIERAGGLTPASQVLEIGVGTGRIALPLASRVHTIFGLDLSRPMMDRLRAKQAGERILLIEGDATRLPFRNRSFDAAVAVHVFHLIANWRGVLDELARVLRPGAPLIHCWSRDDDTLRSLWDAWEQVCPARSEMSVGVHWRRQPNFLEESGWEPVADTLTHTFARQTSPQQFVAQLRDRIWSSCWWLTDDELQQGVTAVEAAAPQLYPALDTPITVTTVFHARAYRPAQ